MVEACWIDADVDPQIVAALTGDCGLTRPTALVLAGRQVAPDEVKAFLAPRLRELGDPFNLPGVEEASKRLWEAIHERQKILIHGDYDTDGITAAALLCWVLERNGAEVSTVLPDRLVDGYGLSLSAIEEAAAAGCGLVVTVDCGITNCEAARRCRELNIDLIITDHHQPGAELPDAPVLINPKLHEHQTRLHGLAGVGVCFKLCHGFIKYGRQWQLGGHDIDLREGLDLVALGTVADIVPLLGENRCLVRYGIDVLTGQRRPGIRALCEVSRLSGQIKAQDIAFRLAPRLNAAGRLGSAGSALQLLQTASIVDAHGVAADLDRLNRRRQDYEENVLKAAMALVEEQYRARRFCLTVAGRDWHQGVLGIVASRLVRRYHRPALVLTIDADGGVHGSGRSVPGVDLVDALATCGGHLDRFGGHPMAVGLSLNKARFEQFDAAIECAVRQRQDGVHATPELRCDGEAFFNELDDRFFSELEQLRPFGHGYRPPVFRFSGLRVSRVRQVGGRHSRGLVCDDWGREMPFIAFGMRPQDLPEAPWNVAGTPELGHPNFGGEAQLNVVGVRPASPGA